jgi:hypothetical protein
MEKRTIRSGLVGAITDDFEGLQKALGANVKKRFRMICERPGYRYDDEARLYFSAYKIPGLLNQFTITIEDMGMVLFRDYDIYTPEGGFENILVDITIDDGDFMYVMVRRIRTLSEPGTYNAGYPTDPGVDTLETVTATIAIEDDLKNDADNYPLYKIQRVGDSVNFVEDYRSNYNLLLISELPQNVEDMAIVNLQATLLHISNIQDETNAPEGRNKGVSLPKNLRSTRLNSIRSGTVAAISWDTVDEDSSVWGYDIRILSGEVDFMEFIPAIPGLTERKVYFPVPEKCAHDIFVRSISRNPLREQGEWSNIIIPYICAIPLAPTIESTSEVTQFPTVIRVVPSYPDPEQITIMHVKIHVQDGGLQENINYEEICYSGVWGPVNVPLPPTGQTTICVKVILEDGTDSPWSIPSESYESNIPALPGYAFSKELTLCLPVDADFDGISETNDVRYMLNFYPPETENFYQIFKVAFRDMGSSYSKGSTPPINDIFFKLNGGGVSGKLLLTITGNDAKNYFFGLTTPQQPNTGYPGRSENHRFMEELSVPITLSAENLYELYIESDPPPAARPIVCGEFTLYLEEIGGGE